MSFVLMYSLYERKSVIHIWNNMRDNISSKPYLQRIEALLQITATLVSLTRG